MKDLSRNMKNGLADVKPSAILAFDQYCNQIPDVVKFTVGEPDFNTPEHIKEAAKAAIDANESHYAPSNGLPELRQATATYLKKRHGHNFTSDEIIITNGATEALSTTFTALLNPGDVVLVPTPTFPLYAALIGLNGGKVVNIDTQADGFVLTPEKLRAALNQYGSKVKAVVLNYPNNPTGVTYTQEQLRALAKELADTDIFVIADEIYADLTYTGRPASIAFELPDQTIVINGVSKSHAMTGWRIGVIAAPKPLMKTLALVHQLAITTTSSVTQYAALAAFRDGLNDADAMKAEYQKRRDYLVAHLEAVGFKCAPAAGAFYVFAKIPAGLNQNDTEFCYELAKQAKVAVIAGSNFGPGGAGWVRLSYATSQEAIERGVARIAAFVAQQENKEG